MQCVDEQQEINDLPKRSLRGARDPGKSDLAPSDWANGGATRRERRGCHWSQTRGLESAKELRQVRYRPRAPVGRRGRAGRASRKTGRRCTVDGALRGAGQRRWTPEDPSVGKKQSSRLKFELALWQRMIHGRRSRRQGLKEDRRAGTIARVAPDLVTMPSTPLRACNEHSFEAAAVPAQLRALTPPD